MIALLVYLAGALGALARFQADGWIKRRWSANLPWATFTINVSGSALLGALAGWALHHPGAAQTYHVLGTGFCGGYTTFSTATVETVRLLQDRRRTGAVQYAIGTLLTCFLACLVTYVALQHL